MQRTFWSGLSQSIVRGRPKSIVMLILKQVQDDSFSISRTGEIPGQARNDGGKFRMTLGGKLIGHPRG